MKSFAELGIKITDKGLTGEKIKIEKILNVQIVINNYKIVESKFEGKGSCLHLQITYKNEMRVLFTGSKGLIEQIEQVGKSNLPITATIVKEDERFEFK